MYHYTFNSEYKIGAKVWFPTSDDNPNDTRGTYWIRGTIADYEITFLEFGKGGTQCSNVYVLINTPTCRHRIPANFVKDKNPLDK